MGCIISKVNNNVISPATSPREFQNGRLEINNFQISSISRPNLRIKIPFSFYQNESSRHSQSDYYSSY